MKNNERIKITVSNPFPIYPPIFGGQLRVYNLYLQLSRWFDIDVVIYANPGIKTRRRQLAEGLFEVWVPKTLEYCKSEARLIEDAGFPVTDIALLKYHQYNPEYVNVLENSCKDSEVVICSHPYTFKAVKAIGKKRVWYDAHNVEYLLKKDMLPKGLLSEELLRLVSEAERECCEKSELVLACSNEDKDKLSELYNINKDKILIAPNGANVSDISCILPSERLKSASEEKTKKSSAIFVGSAHGPNLVAIDYIVNMAAELPWVQFIIVGGAGEYLENREVPQNVVVMGILEEKDKDAVLSSADIALNPMTYGSGTNLKILEYFAFGIPVISTPIGVRGLNVNHGEHVVICDIEEFVASIRKLLTASMDDNDKLAKTARKFVENHFDWGIIAHRLIDELKQRETFSELQDDNYQLNNIQCSNFVNTSNYDLSRIRLRDVYIWGAGSAGRKVLKLLRNAGISVKGFIDSDLNKWGNYFDGIQAFSISSLEKQAGSGNAFIIIASTYADEIERQLNSMGYRSGDNYLIQDINYPHLHLYC